MWTKIVFEVAAPLKLQWRVISTAAIDAGFMARWLRWEMDYLPLNLDLTAAHIPFTGGINWTL